jgi:hypothetical protein
MSAHAASSYRRSAIAPFVDGLIAVSVLLQLIATSRILHPPQPIRALTWLRIAGLPRLWPFVDYPMFSAPHRLGESLAWVEAHRKSMDGRTASTTSHEVTRTTADETWESAYEQAESYLRLALQPELSKGDQRLVFERHLLVLTDKGLVPP